jgi:hypothetical protein
LKIKRKRKILNALGGGSCIQLKGEKINNNNNNNLKKIIIISGSLQLYPDSGRESSHIFFESLGKIRGFVRYELV